MTLHHARHAQRERDGHDCGQAFRHGRHRQTHRREEHRQQRLPSPIPQSEDDRDNPQRQPQQRITELLQSTLQRRFSPLRFGGSLNHRGDAAQFGMKPGRHDQRARFARHNDGAHKDHVGSLRNDRPRCHRGLCVLLNRRGLAGE